MSEWLARDNSVLMKRAQINQALVIGGEEVTDLVIPDGTTQIKPCTFYKVPSIKTVSFPATLKTIGDSTFYSCQSLQAINLPASLTALGTACFAECKKAETLSLPEGLTAIPDRAFYGCGLEEVTVPETVTAIGEAAFAECRAMTTLSLPDALEVIGPELAYECQSLQEIRLPKSLKSIDLMAFTGTYFLRKVFIPKEIGDVELTATQEAIEELEQEKKELPEDWLNAAMGFASVSEIHYEGDMRQWLAHSREWLMRYVGAGIAGVDEENEQYIFLDSTRLFLEGSDEPIDEVLVPDGVTEVPAFAFRRLDISAAQIGKAVTAIGDSAFMGCKNLKSIDSYAWNAPALGTDVFAGTGFIRLHPWYTAYNNYNAAEGWKDLFMADHYNPDGFLPDDYVYASVKDGQEALGTVRIEVPEENRTGFVSENKVSVKTGTEFTLIAEPEEKCRFVRWEHFLPVTDVWMESSTEATCTKETYASDYNGNQNQYRAVFEKDSFDIAVTVKGINPEMVEITGAGRFGRGDDTELTYKINDENQVEFICWEYKGKTFFSSSLVFENIDANHEVTIEFKANQYTVTAVVTPEGAGTVSGQGTYNYGEDYTLTLVPAEGYELAEWRDGVALDEKTNTLTGTVYGNIQIECVLQLKQYTVTTAVNDEKMGSVTGADTYEHGAQVTLTATPKSGYRFVSWSNEATDNPLVFTATEDIALTANFELIPDVVITVLASPEEGGAVIGSGTYPAGTEVTLVASANLGYTFTGWDDGESEFMRKVIATEDKTYTALFKKKGDTTGVDDVRRDDVRCTKVLRDGVLYLMYEGQMYDVQGQRVR